MLGTILLVFAFVFLVLAAAGVPAPPRFPAHWGWLGLALWLLSILLGHIAPP